MVIDSVEKRKKAIYHDLRLKMWKVYSLQIR